MKHVIIGNGIAGESAAQSIRGLDSAADITIVTEEDMPFYSRMRLPEFVGGTLEEKKLIIHKESWYEENRISLMKNQKVVSIDSGPKQVVLGDNSRIAYDRLLVATGGRAVTLPLPGVEKRGVFTLRNIQDARNIRAEARESRTAIIIGGGVLGLEIANAMLKLGVKVTVIEFFNRLLPRQMDREGSSVLLEKLRDRGMNFFLGVRTEEILGGEELEGVRLCNGTQVNGQIVIISAGMKPEVSLFAVLQLKPGKGVPVDDRMETGLPDIYAAGDVAEHRQKSYGIWPAAEKQGEVAGLNMAGGSAIYEGTPISHSVSVAGITLYSAGDIDADNTLPSFAYEDRTGGIYRKIVVRNNKITGCILCGDTTGRKELTSAIEEKRDVRELKETLEKLEMKPVPDHQNK